MNTLKPRRVYYRCDIARLTGYSERWVTRNRKWLGLVPPVRLPDANKRLVRFDADAVDKILVLRGFAVPV